MSKLTTEEIAEIRNALTIINLTTENSFSCSVMPEVRLATIKEQVKRIDKLLPVVKFEGGE